MIDHNDERWLQALLEQAVSSHWCTRINCTTCGSEPLRDALALTPEAVATVIYGLRSCSPRETVDHPFEEAVRWVLYEVWSKFGDRPLVDLDGTYAGEVLARMRTHEQGRQHARRQHEARQGVKKRDWEE